MLTDDAQHVYTRYQVYHNGKYRILTIYKVRVDRDLFGVQCCKPRQGRCDTIIDI